MPGAVATVLGGFWPTNGVSVLSQTASRGPLRRRAAAMLDAKSTFALRRLMTSLNGVAPGAAALKTFGRVVASSELGGQRATELETLVNRNTAAGDVTTITADILSFSTRTYNPSPVPNGDGNPLGTR